MYSSLAKIQAKILNHQLSCKEIIGYYLKNIEEKSNLNVFLEVYEEEALARAEEIDQKILAGTQGRLAGMVVGLKDVLCYEGHSLQCASKILDGFKSQFTATAVEKLLKEDAIVIGRQNCDEFAMGSSNENSAFDVVKNGIGENKVPGGSSGASAVAVQTDMCLISLGSDTGGSVRQPAAFCGVIGMKPTYSRISRYGLAAYASSFDCIGILSKTIEDNALVLEVIAGQDDFDSTVSQKEVPTYTKAFQIKEKYNIAFIRETIESEGLHEEVRRKTLEKIDWLRSKGHNVRSFEIPALKYILPTYYILTTAEASSNLARYDGVRYGFRNEHIDSASTNVNKLEQMYKKSRSEGFGEEVKRRIMLGTFVLSADYYDAYYTKAQKVRRLIQQTTQDIFSENDFIVLPTTPSTAFDIGSHQQDLVQMYLEDLFTVQANVTGIPAISIPNGTDENGLPIGFQIMADAFQEKELLSFAKYILENH